MSFQTFTPRLFYLSVEQALSNSLDCTAVVIIHLVNHSLRHLQIQWNTVVKNTILQEKEMCIQIEIHGV